MNSYELNSALSLEMAFRCGLVAILFIAIPASVSCLRCISCQCGLSSINNTHCTENGSTEKFSCEKWAGCQTCRDNITYCVACPNKRSGPFCKDDAVPIKHSHRQKRVYVSSSCEKPGQFYNGILQIYPPMNAPIGSVDDTELPAGTRLFYSCYKGFELHGKANQICEDSFWSAEPPTCIKEKQPARCPDPGIPAGASRESVDGADESAARNYLEGEALYFYCDDEDYVLVGAYVINCTSFGNWTDAAPGCRRDEKNGCNNLPQCPNEGPIDHGRVQVSLNLNEQLKCVMDYRFPAGTVLHYSCDEGYVLRGTTKQICQSNGSWFKEKPSCIAGNPSPTNGNIDTKFFVFRIPVYNGDRNPEDQNLGQGVRHENDRGTYIPVRWLTTIPETTTPIPTIPAEPEPQSSNSADHKEEYSSEIYEYEETAIPAPTTTIKSPVAALQPAKPTTTKAPTSSSGSRSSSHQGRSSSTSAAPAATTRRPVPSEDDSPMVRSDGDIECFGRGIFVHPTESGNFVYCNPFLRDAGHYWKGRVFNLETSQPTLT